MIDIRFGNCHDIIKEMDDESVDMILTERLRLNLFIMTAIFLGLIREHLSFIG